jgi:hypothetical protein
MAAAIDRLAAYGWQAEGRSRYGFVFIRRETERRLLTLTPRDRYDMTPQSFSPFDPPARTTAYDKGMEWSACAMGWRSQSVC